MIAVALLNKLKIADHLLPGNGMANIRPVLMTVYSLELNRNAIREENPAFYLNFPETGSGRQDFNYVFPSLKC